MTSPALIAPYGHWKSPITSELVASRTRGLSSPRVCRKSGRAFFAEVDGGRRTIMEITPSGIMQILPSAYSVVNTVYEYGASFLDILGDGRIIFSSNNAIAILDPDTHEVIAFPKAPHLRYSSFSANTKTPWVLAIEEDHGNGDAALDVRHFMVAINVSSGEVKRIAADADFYFSPQSNADGTRVAWLEWNHPQMFYNSAKLFCADWNVDGGLSNSRLVSGENNESVAEPRWGLDGNTLFFAQDVAGYRQLFKVLPGGGAPIHVKIDGLEKAEIGEPLEGSRTYVPITERYLVAAVVSLGVSQPVVIDLESNTFQEAADADTLSSIVWDSIARLDDSSVLVMGSGTSSPRALYKIDIHRPRLVKQIRRSSSEEIPRGLISKPQSMSIPSKAHPDRPIHGFLWLPQNPEFTAPKGSRMPLIIWAHGGPTARADPGLSLRIHFFTSRGYAYFALNHTGSTGYGREYRNALFGQWGVLDVAEAADAANFFTTGSIRAGAVGITGISAGGYHTLQCLATYPATFAAGICASGISEMKTFDEATHKLEWNYVSLLLGLPDDNDRVKDKIYRERSALTHVGEIESPLLLLHGRQDTVAPIEQARIIAEALQGRGRDVQLVEFDDGHMLSKPSVVKTWLEEEERWWRKHLL